MGLTITGSYVNGQPSSPSRRSDFFTTRWSIVLKARDFENGDAAGEALETLCEAYWYPIYTFARRSGNRPHDAQDLTQQFFSHLLEKHALDSVDRDRGRFRSFLLSSFKNVMTNEWRRATAQKRGGGQVVFSLDDHEPESRYRREPSSSDLSPDLVFEKRWAETLVDRVLDRLRVEWESAGKPFDKLKVFLVGRKGAVKFADAAAELGVTEAALKTAVHRMRKRYGELFRDEIAQTVGNREEVDDEVRHLLSALGG